MSQVRPISRIPSPVVRDLPPPVVSVIEPLAPPVTRGVPVPVTRGLKAPVIDVPDPTIDYPVIDVPTKEEWEQVIENQNEESEPTPRSDTRDLPATPPTVNVGGLDVPLPEVAPLITAGATAVVTTTVALGAGIVINQIKTAADPLIQQLTKKKKKVKVKQVKPVLHFVPNGEGSADIIEYSAKGMKVLESKVEKLEQYLRDQVDLDSFWEYDNKIIIDEELSKSLTKDGVKRFKKYFQPPKVIAKKLGAKFSI